MSKPGHTLDELQRWMQAVITHPAGVEVGIESFAAQQQIGVVPEQAERVIARSQAQSALERLEIYNRAYFGRLLECLREEYSVLAAALGTEIFDSFAMGYLHAHPSRSYTLNDLGAHFPEFLAETRPPRGEEERAGRDWPEFMIDLARVERAVNEVFDGPGIEGERLLDAAALQTIAAERWPGARLLCVPCLKLLQLNYPVNDYFAAIRRGDTPAIPEPGISYLVVTRRDYRVRRFPLELPAYELLSSLARGLTIGEAVRRAADVSELADEPLARRIGEWFRFWAAEGLFWEMSNDE